jgi:hypothetical protein
MSLYNCVVCSTLIAIRKLQIKLENKNNLRNKSDLLLKKSILKILHVWTRVPHYRAFTISPRHTTLGRTPLEEWPAQRRDLYLTHTALTTARHLSPRRDSNPQYLSRAANVSGNITCTDKPRGLVVRVSGY